MLVLYDLAISLGLTSEKHKDKDNETMVNLEGNLTQSVVYETGNKHGEGIITTKSQKNDIK